MVRESFFGGKYKFVENLLHFWREIRYRNGADGGHEWSKKKQSVTSDAHARRTTEESQGQAIPCKYLRILSATVEKVEVFFSRESSFYCNWGSSGGLQMRSS